VCHITSAGKFMLSGSTSSTFRLRPEQLRSLAWMLAREGHNASGDSSEDTVEDEPFQAYYILRSSILCDRVGFGKTATTIGLIDTTQNDPAPKVPAFLRRPRWSLYHPICWTSGELRRSPSSCGMGAAAPPGAAWRHDMTSGHHHCGPVGYLSRRIVVWGLS